MGTPQLHDVYPARFNSFSLNQIDNESFTPGIEALIAMAGGSVDPALDAIAQMDNRWKFSSRDLATVLANVNIVGGLSITSGAKMQFQRRLHAGTFASGTSHVNLSSPVGFLYIQEFGFEQGSKEGGDMSLEYVCAFDGTNDPCSVNVSQALVGTPAVNSVHGLGPVVFEGSQVQGVTKWRVKTGIEVMIQQADGEAATRIVAINKRMQTIEIEALNLTILNTIGVGKFPISSGCTAYAQKVLAGGHHVSWASSVHISAGISQGTYTVEEISGSKGQNANTKITVLATNNNLSVNPATTIPL